MDKKALLKYASLFPLTLLSAAVSAAVSEYWDIELPDGRPFVTLEIHGEGQEYQFNDEVLEDGELPVSDWDLLPQDKERFHQAFDFLGRMLQKSVHFPSSITVVTEDANDDNASAYSPNSSSLDAVGHTYLGAELIYGIKPDTDSGTTALITIDHSSREDGEWYAGAMHTLPDNDDYSDLTSTVTHELFHALGLACTVDPEDPNIDINDVPKYTVDGYDFFKLQFSELHSNWTAGLRDGDGTAAVPGMKVTPYGGTAEAKPDTFDMLSSKFSASGVYFTGENVQKVLNGALIYYPDGADIDPVPGLPVNGWEPGEGLDALFPELSHIELQNSLMSHQSWRNWNTFMEAEIAVLQDIGYEIDRRDWFGYSVYNSGEEGNPYVFVNTNPFYARNAQGTAYVTGAANDNPWGIGLHVYGSYTDVTQAAEILSNGDYAIGIRVDGFNNTLRIAQNATVRSDGAEGYGLAVTYGKGHHIIHQGTLAAAGGQGIAAVFSFGDNELGENYEQRGSFIFAEREYSNADLTDSNPADVGLDGALVDNFDVSGTLIGRQAAIFIDDNALVSNINILQGSRIAGDIVSLWDPLADRVQSSFTVEDGDQQSFGIENLITQLNFGLAANEDGSADPSRADENFYLSYSGNIYGGLVESEGADSGAAAIAIRVAAGTLSFNGNADVLSVTVDENATLSGNAEYNLTSLVVSGDEENSDESETIGGTFVNNGTISPGNSIGKIVVNGAFVMGDSGKLLMEFSPDGSTDTLVVSELVKNDDEGEAGVVFDESNVTMAPAEGYYSAPLTISLNEMIFDGEKAVDVKSAALLSAENISPTLTMKGSVLNGELTVETTRAADAYSQYAVSKEAQSVAFAFDRYAAQAQGQMQDLVSALDFSSPDGSSLNSAFESLSADLYGRAGAAALSAQRVITRAVMREQSKARSLGIGSGESVFFAVPLGGYADRSAEGVRSTFAGLLAGVQTERAFESGTLTVGGHTAVLTRRDKFTDSDGSKADSDSFYLGVNGRYDFAGAPGVYAFGLAQLAIENTDMERSVMGGFDKASSDWTGWGASFAAGVGKSFSLSESVALGPVLWLDYSFMHLPSVKETSAHGTALRTEDETYESLVSTLGVRMDYALPVVSADIKASGLVAWNHEFLDNYGTASASFASWRGTRFDAKADARADDTATAAVSLKAKIKENFSASIGAGVDFGGSSAGWGNVGLKWIF